MFELNLIKKTRCIRTYQQTLIALCLLTIFIVSYNSYALTVSLPTWQLTSLPNAPSLRGSAVKGNSLWVSGSNNAVFVSQDAGKTWLDKSVQSPIKTGFRDIALFNSQTAIVMGVGSGAQSVLYKTTDGGDHWQLLYQNKDKAGFFDSIAFWNEKNGLLLGDPVDGFYVIKRTTDGGKTWHRIAKKHLPKLLTNEAAFAASGNTLIVGKNGNAWLTTGGFSASVYKSHDFGESWQRDVVPLFNETQTAGGYGLALSYTQQSTQQERQQIFVVGGDYLQRSKSYSNMATFLKGKWTTVATGQHGLRSAMSCQGNICISTGKTSSDISYNAGKTWQVLKNDKEKVENKGFYTLASDNMLFLAAGAAGKVGVLYFN
jgi:photosystem II stability/assembly factor-like uncharacterized protein